MSIDVGFPRKDNPKEYDRLWHQQYNKAVGYKAQRKYDKSDKWQQRRNTYQREYYGTVRRMLEKKYNRYRQTDRINDYLDQVDFSFIDFLCRIATERCIKCNGIDYLGLGRKDHTKGHTTDNTYVVCWGCHVREPKPRR